MGVISQAQLEDALQTQQSFFGDVFHLDLDRTELVTGSRKNESQTPKLGQILVQKGYVKEEQLNVALTVQKVRLKFKSAE